ncbi:MAG: ATP synthase F1 subunit delta [bacterium]
MSSESSKSSEKTQTQHKRERTLSTIRTRDYRIAIAWARALFQVAKANKVMNEIVEDFESFIDIWDKLPIIRDFLGCYAIDRSLKREKINEFFSEKFSPPFLAFLQMSVSRGKTDLLGPIYDAFIQMYDELEGREKVTIQCAAPFTKAQKNRLQDVLQQILEKRSVILNQEIHTDLLGGFIVDANKIRIDTSLKNDLECLKRNILSMEIKQDEH